MYHLACHIDALAQIGVDGDFHIPAEAQVAVYENRAAALPRYAQNRAIRNRIVLVSRSRQPHIGHADVHQRAALLLVHHEAQVVNRADLQIRDALGAAGAVC
jgi:hypothetical protein